MKHARARSCSSRRRAGCGDNRAPCPLAFADGDPDGHPEPLGAGAGEARAGRIRDDQLPAVASGLVTWRGGDFVLANDQVALVIEDAGDSDLYDPWGGRPVGLARVTRRRADRTEQLRRGVPAHRALDDRHRVASS